MTTLRNANMIASYDELEKSIRLKDLTDLNNEPAAYNNSLRGLKKAWLVLEQSFTQDMTMDQAYTILDQNGIWMHTYCMMD